MAWPSQLTSGPGDICCGLCSVGAAGQACVGLRSWLGAQRWTRCQQMGQGSTWAPGGRFHRVWVRTALPLPLT